MVDGGMDSKNNVMADVALLMWVVVTAFANSLHIRLGVCCTVYTGTICISLHIGYVYIHTCSQCMCKHTCSEPLVQCMRGTLSKTSCTNYNYRK